jgi:ectoine hydroxylase-related dioxygenase (phytanoyl-CoA dioxygenase family)
MTKRVASDAFDDTPWVKQLEEEGYAVIENVLTPAECNDAMEKVHAYLAAVGADVVTEGAPKDYPNIHGIIQHLQVGHCDGVWQVRQNANVIDKFAQIYGDNDLLCSFDGVCIMQPWHRFGAKPWAHMDQSAKITERSCIQGYVNLTDASTDATGSLYVIPRSHTKFAEFFEKFPEMRESSKGDWCKLESPEQHAFFGADAVRVHGGVGSLVLWDSRSVHQSIPPASRTDAKKRCVVYVSYQPRACISVFNLQKKKKAFAEYRMTTHWSASKFRVFAAKPRIRSRADDQRMKEFTIVRDRRETPLMLELAGVAPMRTKARILKTPALAFQFCLYESQCWRFSTTVVFQIHNSINDELCHFGLQALSSQNGQSFLDAAREPLLSFYFSKHSQQRYF